MATPTRKSSDMDNPLPFSSLRFLAPPFRLVSAAMWKVMKQRDVMHYGRLEEFVTSCCETVPGLLTSRHQAKLALGLRARLILELCRIQDPPDPATILPQLDRICAPTRSSALKKDVKIETAVTNLRGLVESLLKDPTERLLFYKVEFPSEYGPQFELELEKLLWEFLLRLDQLLPVPNLAQTVSWLSAAPPVLEECAHAASQPQLLKSLLQHQVCLGHLDSAASLPPCMGDSILSSLSLPPSGRVAQSNQSESKPASVATASTQSLRQVKNKSSVIAPIIGNIIQSDSRKEKIESRVKSKYAAVKNRDEDSDDDEEDDEEDDDVVIVRKQGRKRNRSARDEGSRRGLRWGCMEEVQTDEESELEEVQTDEQSEQEEVTNVNRGESRRDFPRVSLVRLDLAELKFPENHPLGAYITSCLLNQPQVLVQRLPSTDIPTTAKSPSPRSPGKRTPTATGSPWLKNVSAARRLPSTRQRKLSDSSLTMEMELPASADKENCAFPLAHSPSCLPLPQTRRSSEMQSSPGNAEEVIGDSEDEGTKNFKCRLFVKRYYRTKHNTYVPTLREFWKPGQARRNLLSPGNGQR